MCGIAGFIEPHDFASKPSMSELAGEMARRLHHRGPDDRGDWIDADCGIGLAHTRLSILDVSQCGHQPMVSRDGRHVLVFNGEVYNFQDIRKRLVASGSQFVSDSDTEVLVEAIATWGLEKTLPELVGMFAFGVWDREKRTLSLARDRLGEKPLYHGWLGNSFVFASELKALRAHPEWTGTIDREALTLYLRHGYVPGPRSIYAGIAKLPPGCLLRVGRVSSGQAAPEPYWTLQDAAERAPRFFDGSEVEAIDRLENILRKAIHQQMVADVPLGAFLSGGVDSATVVALMQAESASPVRTFTIGVNDPTYDEAPAARAIAGHLRTQHTELYVNAEDGLELIPRLSEIYDEPFADSSQIPTLLVSQLARRSVTVSLTGDGGDELFGGYERYVRAPALATRLGRIPGPLRRQIGRALLARPALAALDSTVRFDGGRIAERGRRLGEILEHHSPLGIYRALHSSWPQPASVVVSGSEPLTPLTSPRLPWSGKGFAEQMLIADAVSYLPDDLLVKVDRASMAVSLETRVPMLDHRVVEFALKIPWDLKVRGGVRKWILREVLHRHVPRNLVVGPKRGFAIPIGEWLRGPLRSWADRLLDKDRIRAEGFFKPELIHAKWVEHKKGTFDWSSALWTVLMFQAWYESQVVSIAPAVSAPSLISSDKDKVGVVYLMNTLGGGGTEKSLLEILPRLQRVNSMVCQIFRHDGLQKEYEAAGIRVVELDVSESVSKKFRITTAVRRFEQVVLREKPDLIVTAHFASNVVGRLIGKRYGIPVVGNFVGEPYAELKSRGLPLVRRARLRIFQLADALTARWVSHFLANSEAIKNSECTALRVPAGKVTVIYRGRDPGEYGLVLSEEQKQRYREALGLSASSRIVANVGRLIYSKGQTELIDAFSEVVRVFPDATLLIIGTGPFEEELERRIRDTKQESSVRLLGWRDDIPHLLALADIFAFPSHHEGHPGAVVEAMFAGKPIVVSDIPVHRETIAEGESGLLVPLRNAAQLAEALKVLLGNKTLRRGMGEQARQRAIQLYHIDRIAEQHDAICEQIVRTAGRHIA